MSLENEVLYLKSKLSEATAKVELMQERVAGAVAPPPKRAKSKAKPKASTKKAPKKKK